MPTRRAFLADVGMGFTGLASGSLLARDGVARADAAGKWAPPDGKPHFAPKAKNVIWLFMVGGASHVEGLRPQAGPQSIRRQDDRRDALSRKHSTRRS